MADPARAAMLGALLERPAARRGRTRPDRRGQPGDRQRASRPAAGRRPGRGGRSRAGTVTTGWPGTRWPTVLEVLADQPAGPVRSLRQSREAAALAQARTCYDHLAGRAGVALFDALHRSGGPRPGAAPARGRVSRSPVAARTFWRSSASTWPRSGGPGAGSPAACLDWTQRRPHLNGALGAAVTARLLELGWIERGPSGRPCGSPTGPGRPRRDVRLVARRLTPGSPAKGPPPVGIRRGWQAVSHANCDRHRRRRSPSQDVIDVARGEATAELGPDVPAVMESSREVVRPPSPGTPRSTA